MKLRKIGLFGGGLLVLGSVAMGVATWFQHLPLGLLAFAVILPGAVLTAWGARR